MATAKQTCGARKGIIDTRSQPGVADIHSTHHCGGQWGNYDGHTKAKHQNARQPGREIITTNSRQAEHEESQSDDQRADDLDGSLAP